MANAKSRFVRILALALAVLMVVPMALVGCKKDEDGVNKEMLDAAIKEALDAAQAAQDAADKAASDAKDAQDKLDAAQKESDKLKAEADKLKEESDKLKAEADKLKGEVESLKNTTTTKPAPTTTVKVETDADKKVVDDYVAALLNDKDSELNKLLKTYGYNSKDVEVTSKTFAEADQKSAAAIIADVLLAIQRAHTIDYANQLVASLKTALDAVPTYSERVKAAYDAIDFASDKDVIDVVYAANLVVKALDDLKGSDTASKNEVKALKAFGADKINLVDAIATEYYRYTGNAGKIEGASIKDQSDIKVLYKAAYDAVKDAKIADDIRTIYNVAAADKKKPAALKTSKIVWSATLETEIEAIEDSYKTWKSKFDNAAAKELYAELCIAFVGEDYILTYEGDILNEKLAAAKERFAQLDAAASEYDKASFGDKLKKIVDEYEKDGMNYLYTNKFTKYGVDYVNGLLSAWMSKYSFSATGDGKENLTAIIGDDYTKFVAARDYVNYINEWALKAAALDVDAIADALEEFDDEETFSYNQYGSVVKSLYTYFAGTEAKEGKDGLLAAIYKEAKVYDEANDVVANVEEIISEVFGKVTLDDIADICDYLNKELAGYVKDAKTINTDIAKLDPEKADFSYLEDINAINAQIKTLFTKMDIAYDEEEGWDLDEINADLVNWDALETLEAAYDAVRENLMGEAASIVKNYIAWKGAVTEDGTITYKLGKKTYEIEADPFVISLYSQNDIFAMRDIYETLLDAIAEGVAADVTLDFVTVEDVLEDEFTLQQVVNFYREMSDRFHYTIATVAHAFTYTAWEGTVFKNGNSKAAASTINPWAPKDAATAVSPTVNAKTGKTFFEEWNATYKIKYVLVSKDQAASSKTDGTEINVYNTLADYGDGTYLKAVESVDPDQFATWAGEDELRRLDSFDYAKYAAAVKASVDAAYTKWYAGFLKTNKNIDKKLDMSGGMVYKAIKYALAYGLWNVADEFEMDDEEYSFKILPIDFSGDIKAVDSIDEIYAWNPTFVVYDEDGEIVADNKITVDKVEYTISVGISEKAVIDYATNDKGTTSASDDFNYGTAKFTALPEIVIYASYEDDEDGDGTPETVVKTLAELLDAEGEYLYTLADGVDEIYANSKVIGSIKDADSTSSISSMISVSYINKVLDAYEQHKFYSIHKAVWNIMNTYKNKPDISAAAKAAITQLAAEYGVKYKSVTYGSMTAEDLYKALARFEGEAEAIIAENPAPVLE